MLNIVIPMAGAGSRFAKKGYKDPKPLVSVNGVPMIELVINNLKPHQPHRFIFICQAKHLAEYDLHNQLKRWSPKSEIVTVNGLTEGAACTVLAAKLLINNDAPLMIANSDQYIDFDISVYLSQLSDRQLDGLIMTMTANDPKWSYVGIDSQGHVNRVVEKEVISDEATVGIYNFAHGSDFVKAAETMIHNNERVNNEFYVAPCYNQMIECGAKIGICNIGREGEGMYGLGIPEDLDLFLRLPIHKKATERLVPA